MPPDLYNVPEVLLKAGAVVLAGVVVYLLVSGQQDPERLFLKKIRERPRSFHGLFLSFALGLARNGCCG